MDLKLGRHSSHSGAREPLLPLPAHLLQFLELGAILVSLTLSSFLSQVMHLGEGPLGKSGASTGLSNHRMAESYPCFPSHCWSSSSSWQGLVISAKWHSGFQFLSFVTRENSEDTPSSSSLLILFGQWALVFFSKKGAERKIHVVSMNLSGLSGPC